MGVFGLAQPALANGMSSVIGFWPGFLVISPLWGLPATLLAAFLERPFVTRSGVRRYGLAYSIRANLLSWLLGVVIVIVLFAGPVEVLFVLWPVCSVPLTIWIEGSYLRRVAAKQAWSLRHRWIIAGNLVSALVLIAIGPVSLAIGEKAPLLAWKLRPYEDVLLSALSLLSLAIVAYGLWPRRVEVAEVGPQGCAEAIQHKRAEHEVREPVAV